MIGKTRNTGSNLGQDCFYEKDQVERRNNTILRGKSVEENFIFFAHSLGKRSAELWIPSPVQEQPESIFSGETVKNWRFLL